MVRSTNNTKKKTSKKQPTRRSSQTRLATFFSFTYKRHSIKVLLDKVQLFRVMRRLHGRFWGIAGLIILGICLTICSLIRPDIITDPNGALSMFGTDTRTAPWFAFGMFFAAYGIWNWRNYLLRTMRHRHPMSWLIGLTIAGLLIVAFMPMDWKPIVSKIHIVGFSLVGISMALTVITDSVLTKVRPRKNLYYWRLLRLASFILIVSGSIVAIGSLEQVAVLRFMLVGELLMIAGYGLWVGLKTHLGEGKRSALSRLLSKIVLVD